VRGPHSAFGDAIPVPDDAPVTDELVAFLGRRPNWDVLVPVTW
jgi:hypothetical protein